MTRMDALVLESFGTMVVERRPRPEPGPGEALLRTLATGICGSDLHGYTGENGRRVPGQVMGHETAALVVGYGDGLDEREHPSVGSAVTFNPTISCGRCAACQAGLTHICADRRVIGVDPRISAGFGAYLTVPARNLVALPLGMPQEHGALVEPLAVGYHAANRGGVVPGSTVLVVGAGPIGQAAILAARRLGAGRILVSEPSPSRRALAERLGGESLPAEDPVGAVLQASGGIGADLAIDAVGASATVDVALRATRRGGNVVLVGMNAQRLDLDAYRVSTDERALIGAFCYSHEEFVETAAWAATATDLLESLISSRVPLSAGPEAFHRLAEGGSDESKVLVVFAHAEELSDG